MSKKGILAPVLALLLITLGGLILHLKHHFPFKEDGIDWLDLVPAVCGIVAAVALTIMFFSARTVKWAYLINLLIVIIGVVGMAYHSYNKIIDGKVALTLKYLISETTLADILIVLAKIPIANVILRAYRKPSDSA